MIVLLLLISLFIKESLLLRMVKVSVPKYMLRGQPTLLECNYELLGDSLYSVKWYRDNEEFYRYIPKLDPKKHAYRVDGVKVDISKSDDKKVWLHQVTLKSSGHYRCEVSAEAPSFASAAGEGTMDVIYLPREGPRISGGEQDSRRGDYLVLNCTSARSYPAAVLSWDIDGEKVTNPDWVLDYGVTSHAHGLLSSTLGLRFPLRRSMQVRCKSRVAPTLPQIGELVGGSSLTDNREAVLLVRSSTVGRRACVALLVITTLTSLAPTILSLSGT